MTTEEYKKRQEVCNQEKFMVETNKRLQNLELALAEHEKRLNIQEAFHGGIRSDVDQMNNEIMHSTMTILKEFRQEIGNIETNVNKLENKIYNLNKEQELLANEDDVNTLYIRITESIKDIHKKVDALHQEHNGLIERLKLDICNQLKALKEEILSRPTGIPELQKLLESKIELVELNSQNGVLRSSNNEKQLLLVERKIDNLYQLIKKIELDKE